jgi:hypothetical protein
MPADVSERVHLIALEQKVDPNNFVTDVEDLEAHDESSQQSEDDNYTGQWQSDIDEDELDNAHFYQNNIFNSDYDDPLQEYVESIDNDDNDQNTDYPETVQHEQAEQTDQITGVDNISDNVTLDQRMDDQYGARLGHYNLRPRKEHNFSHLFHTIGSKSTNSVYDTMSMMTTQMSMQLGLLMFGDEGAKAVQAELKQLHDQGVMVPRQSNLTLRQKENALVYLTILKRKRC